MKIKPALKLTRDKWEYIKSGKGKLSEWKRFSEIEKHLNICPLCEYSQIQSPQSICSACPINKYEWCDAQWDGDADTSEKSIDMLLVYIENELSLLEV